MDQLMYYILKRLFSIIIFYNNRTTIQLSIFVNYLKSILKYLSAFMFQKYFISKVYSKFDFFFFYSTINNLNK